MEFPDGVVDKSISAYSGDYNELVYLRARFYAPGMGRFLTKDSWTGDYNRPMSFNRWMYVEGNPINLTDPSGRTPAENGNYPRHCQAMPTKAAYESCVLQFFELEPINPNRMGETVTGNTGCFTGPKEYRAPGYIEGIGFTATLASFGGEVVYDYATMERQIFKYDGFGFSFSSVGVSSFMYNGHVQGLKNSFIGSAYNLNDDYSGISHNLTVGGSLGVNEGKSFFWSDADPLIRGEAAYFGGGLGMDIIPLIDITSFNLDYSPRPDGPFSYVSPNGDVDTGSLMNDIRQGKESPLFGFGAPLPPAVYLIRLNQAVKALKYAYAYKALRFQDILGW
jgi:RHS repeat-associated protein